MLKQTEAEKREERIGFHFRGGERNIARNTLFVETVRRMFGGKVIVTSAYLKTIFFCIFHRGPVNNKARIFYFLLRYIRS